MQQPRILMKHQRTAVDTAAIETVGQFIYPTGTGKSLIEAYILIEAIRKNPGFAVYQIVLPRILLAHQIFEDIWKEVVVNAGLDALMFSLHSDKSKKQTEMVKNIFTEDDLKEEENDQNEMLKLQKKLEKLHVDTSLTFESGTSVSSIKKQIEIAKERNVPLIICSTYHSGFRIENALEGEQIEILICDEAHNAVSQEFSYVHDLPAKKRFYFTATRKLTEAGESGMGMANAEKFGPILNRMSPAEAINFKLIVRPRVHFIEGTAAFSEGEEYKADAHAISISFMKHVQMVRIGAKLLVACRGTKEIQDIVELTDYFKNLRNTYPLLKVFSIYSGDNACRIDGVPVKRSEFMSQLQGMADHEQAIILHYDILSEGIDVPGITGILPLRPLGTAKFLQTLGRSTRLNSNDRTHRDIRETEDKDGNKWDDSWTKPYAWVIVPDYGILGSEIRGSIFKNLDHLRTEWDWIPHDDIFISTEGGETPAEPLGSLYKNPVKKIPKQVNEFLELTQQIEAREKAIVVSSTLSKMALDALIEMVV